jgi:hypothetical protein
VHGGSQTWSMPAKPTEIKQLVMLPRVTSLEKDHVFNLEEGLVPQCIITPGLYGIIDIAPNGENQKTYTLIKIENNVLSVINAASSPEIVVTFTRIKDNNNEWSGWQIKGLCEKNNSGTQKTISVSPSAMPAQSNSLVTSLDQPLASSDSSATLPDNAMKIDDLYTLAKINPLEKGTVFNLTRTVIYLLVMTDSGTEGCHEMLESGLHEITNIIDEYSAGQLVKRTLNITNIKNYQAFEIVFKRPLNYNWIPGEWDMILCKDARTFNGPFQQDPRNPHSK